MGISIIERTRMGVSAFLRAFQSPETVLSDIGHADRISFYDYMWAWEAGSVFDSGLGNTGRTATYAAALKAQYRLYRHTRLVWNPFPDVTAFWGSIIYPGGLTRNGLPFPDGSPTAIPFTGDTDKKIIDAVAQYWAWSGQASLKSVIPHWTSVAGVCANEIVDDTARRKVVARPWWPSLVKEISLNSAGDVLRVVFEYKLKDKGGRDYTYRREIDKSAYRTYKDDKLWDYNTYQDGEARVGAEWENPYGFVPVTWHKHRDIGGVYAAPAIGAMLGQLLEINSVQSQIDDQVRKSVEPLNFVFSEKGNFTALFSGGKRAATSELSPEDADRESINFIKGPADGRVQTVVGSLSIADARVYLIDIKGDFLKHFPEVSMWESLRQRDVSGIAAEILHGDTRNKVLDVRAQHDRQTEKEGQMALAIGGMRANLAEAKGGWGTLSRQQKKFLPFSLESYEAGELDWEVDQRPLIPAAPLSEREKWELLTLKSEGMGVPKKWLVQEEGGYTKKQIKEMERVKAEETPPALQVQPARRAEPLVPVDRGTSVKQIITPGGE